MVSTLSAHHETTFGELLNGIIIRVGGAIEFWTLVCLSQRELGNPTAFVDRHWCELRDQVQELRSRLAESDYEPPPLVQEQVAKLASVAAELREVFDYFIFAATVPQKDLEGAVLRLSTIWQDVRMRAWLLGTLIPLDRPPALSLEKETYYQGVLDALFDQFMAARAESNEFHGLNGTKK